MNKFKYELFRINLIFLIWEKCITENLISMILMDINWKQLRDSEQLTNIKKSIVSHYRCWDELNWIANLGFSHHGIIDDETFEYRRCDKHHHKTINDGWNYDTKVPFKTQNANLIASCADCMTTKRPAQHASKATRNDYSLASHSHHFRHDRYARRSNAELSRNAPTNATISQHTTRNTKRTHSQKYYMSSVTRTQECSIKKQTTSFPNVSITKFSCCEVRLSSSGTSIPKCRHRTLTYCVNQFLRNSSWCSTTSGIFTICWYCLSCLRNSGKPWVYFRSRVHVD